MPGLDGRIFIRDDQNNLIGHHKLKYVTAEKWDETERADVIAFLEQHLTEPPHTKHKEKVKAAETVEDLKAAITDILDEYNFGVLSSLEERISKLEDD